MRFRTIRKVVIIGLILLFTYLALVPGTDKTFATDLKFNMSYAYFGDSTKYRDHIDQTQNSLNEISPNYFNLNNDGNLVLTSALDPKFIEGMHAAGVRVVPFLSNHWDRAIGQAALNNREKLAEQLADEIVRYELDGVHIDLENLTPEERLQHTDFIRILRQRLPKDKIIAVAVASNPYGSTTGWAASYDYEGMSQYSDYLMIMAYDEHYANSEPGAVASYSFAEKSIQYAVKKVPKDKLVLGIAFYGRIWKDGGGFPCGNGLGNKEIDDLIHTYDGHVTFDQKSKTPYAQITIGKTDTKPVVAGKPLEEGTYTIWYENEQSIKEKLKLADQYDLKGTGSWSLGQETNGTWDYYKLWLNGCYFNDAAGHWARDYIIAAYKKDWIKGTDPYSFMPDHPLTRAQAAAILVRMMGLETEKLSYSAADDSFVDIKGHWAHAEIEAARENHIINGIGGNKFDPESPVTREQMAVMMNNILEKKPDGDFSAKGDSFTDVNRSNNYWSYEAIESMARRGIITGFEDNSFRPKDKLTRAQMTKMAVELSTHN